MCIRDSGKVDDIKVARARRVSSVYRIVVQSLANRPLIRPVSKESPAAPPVQPPRKKKTQSATRSQQGKAEKRPLVDLQKAEDEPKETKQPLTVSYTHLLLPGISVTKTGPLFPRLDMRCV